MFPLVPFKQLQVFGDEHEPEPEQTAVTLVAGIPKQTGVTQLLPIQFGLHAQESGPTQLPFPEHTLVWLDKMEKQLN